MPNRVEIQKYDCLSTELLQWGLGADKHRYRGRTSVSLSSSSKAKCHRGAKEIGRFFRYSVTDLWCESLQPTAGQFAKSSLQ